ALDATSTMVPPNWTTAEPPASLAHLPVLIVSSLPPRSIATMCSAIPLPVFSHAAGTFPAAVHPVAPAAREGSDGGPPRPYENAAHVGGVSCRPDPLSRKPEVLDHLSVALDLRGFQVVQQPPPLPDHAEQPAAGRVIALVD